MTQSREATTSIAVAESPFDLDALYEAIDAVGPQAVLDLTHAMVEAALEDISRLNEMSENETIRALHAIRGAAACCGALHLSQIAYAKNLCLPLDDADILELMEAVRTTRKWLRESFPADIDV